MKTRLAFIVVICGIGVALSGCEKDISMTQAEIDAAKKGSPPMTAAQRAAIGALMARGAQDAMNQEHAWAVAHPDKLPAVNAERAKRGLPLLTP